MRIAAVLLAVALGACQGPAGEPTSQLTEQQRLWIWARLVSHERRIEALAGSAAGERAVRDLEAYRSEVRERHQLTTGDLASLAKEAERLRWKDSPACQRSDDVIYGHALVVPPSPLEDLTASYTEAACANEVEGVVLAGLVLSRDGRPESIEILKGLPDGLDERAREAIEAAGWAPALLCGEPVTVHYIVKVVFRLPCSLAADAPASR